jgi:uncharacterized DUF497 family protein
MHEAVTLLLSESSALGNLRWRAEGVMIAVAWIRRGEDIYGIISVRSARDAEKRQYRQIFG